MAHESVSMSSLNSWKASLPGRGRSVCRFSFLMSRDLGVSELVELNDEALLAVVAALDDDGLAVEAILLQPG